MKQRHFFMVFIAVLFFSSTYAQEVEVRALLDTNKALIGDQFNLHLSVEKPASGFQVNFPVVKDTITSQIEVLQVSPIDTTIKGNGRQFLTQDLRITVFDTGFFEIPAMHFTVTMAGGTDTLMTLPVSIMIMPVKADSTLIDIKAIYKMPLSLEEVAPYGLGLLIAGLLVLLLIFYFKNRKVINLRKSMGMSSEPPDIIALRELEILKEEKPWMNNKMKYYYSRLTDILRVYIERSFTIPALEQTTGEILLSLKPLLTDPAELLKLSSILKLADLVKFAKAIPDPEENAIQIDRAVEFIRSTVLAKNSGPEVAEKDRMIIQNKS